MCLDNVDAKPKTNRKTGYKVVTDRGDGIISAPCQCATYKAGEWVTDPKKAGLCTTHFIPYPTGYHIFLSRNDAVRWSAYKERIRRVEFKDVVATGTQMISGTLAKIVVAKEMCIGKEV